MLQMGGQLWLFLVERQRTVDMADEDEGKARNKEFPRPGRIWSDSAASRKEGYRRKGDTS